MNDYGLLLPTTWNLNDLFISDITTSIVSVFIGAKSYNDLALDFENPRIILTEIRIFDPSSLYF